jgi:hypothetical protein
MRVMIVTKVLTWRLCDGLVFFNIAAVSFIFLTANPVTVSSPLASMPPEGCSVRVSITGRALIA